MLKQLFIPIAALAITVTTASAFTGTDWMSKLDISLTPTEQTALEEARAIRDEANEEAESVLEAAGIDDKRMKEIHDAMRESHEETQTAIKAAIKANDYEAYKTAVADTPMADQIDTAEKFAQLVEAHTLMDSGDHDGAKAIMETLGIKGPHGGGMMPGGNRGSRPEPTEQQ